MFARDRSDRDLVDRAITEAPGRLAERVHSWYEREGSLLPWMRDALTNLLAEREDALFPFVDRESEVSIVVTVEEDEL
jgi:hypothetical protein